MAEIVGLDGLSDQEINDELDHGARFVMYSYCISVVILTFRQASAIYFVRGDESRFVKGLPYTFLSLVLGWWGFPFGFIFTPWCVISNCAGGTDVTDEILGAAAQSARDHY